MPLSTNTGTNFSKATPSDFTHCPTRLHDHSLTLWVSVSHSYYLMAIYIPVYICTVYIYRYVYIYIPYIHNLRWKQSTMQQHLLLHTRSAYSLSLFFFKGINFLCCFHLDRLSCQTQYSLRTRSILRERGIGTTHRVMFLQRDAAVVYDTRTFFTPPRARFKFNITQAAMKPLGRVRRLFPPPQHIYIISFIIIIFYLLFIENLIQ